MESKKVIRAGYLQHRPGGALFPAFGRLKKKRYWFVLDEANCQLLYFKSDNDSSQQPLGVMDIREACISIIPDHNNQFSLVYGGKEQIFTADNHRSMMQWLQSLQEVRDSFSSGRKNRYSTSSKSYLFKPTTLTSPSKGLASSPALQRRHSEKVERRKYDETNGTEGIYRKSGGGSLKLQHSKQCTIAESPGLTTNSLPLRGTSRMNSHESLEEVTTASVSDTQSVHTAGTDTDKDSLSTDAGDADVERLPDMDDQEELERLDRASLIQRIKEMREELQSAQRKVMSSQNREFTYQQMLKKREQDIMNLDDKLVIMEQKQHMKRDMLSSEDLEAARQRILDLQDTCKIYQEQTGFLNTEVRRQNSLRKRDRNKMHVLMGQIDSLEGDVLQGKRDYISLVRDGVEVSSMDVKEEVELDMRWEDRRYKKFLHLYDEARMQDPVLPEPRIVMVEGHTDMYGFRHLPHNLPLLFHYVCQVLDGHLQAASKKHADHIRKWELYIERFKHNFKDHQDELRDLVYDGIPADHRSDVWSQLVMARVQHIKAEKNEDYFQWLLSRVATSASVDKYRRQIDLDLLRTMPNNVYFNDKATEGVSQLRQILEAFCVHNPSVGYCQGMNFIAGMSLLFMDVETAFWCLVAVVESYFPPNYFDTSLIGAQADQNILKDILEQKLPQLQSHLDDIGIEMCSFTLNWFLAIFFEVVPFKTLLRIWDCFLLDGLPIIFQFSVALLRYHEQSLLDKKDILAFLKDAKMLAKQTYDVEGLVNLVREGAESFPSAVWIEERQSHYMKILLKVYEEQEKAREEFERQEGLMSSKPILDMPPREEDGVVQDLKMDCAAECMPGHLFVCRGDVRQGWVSRVDVEHVLKEKGGCRLDNRVMCVSLAGLDMVMMGTISWFLYAYSVGTPEELWYERLRDTPLSIVHNPNTKDVYIGLADGTLAVIEGVCHTNPVDIFYHAIGASPVRCVVYIEELDQIWCACGNAVNILNSSLNIVDGFEVSKNPAVHISCMTVGRHGIWITIRGSAVVTLWDIQTLTCMLMYDTSTDRTPIFKKAPHDSQAASKVTSILPYEDTLWVGSADGHIAIYTVTKLETPELQIDQSALTSNGQEEEVEENVCQEDNQCDGVETERNNGHVEKEMESKVKEEEQDITETDREHSEACADKSTSDLNSAGPKSKTKAKNNYETVQELDIVPPPIPPHGYEVEDQKCETPEETKQDAINLPLPLSDTEKESDVVSSKSLPPMLVTDIDESPVLPSKEVDLTPPGPLLDSKGRVPSITPLPALDLDCQLPDPSQMADTIEDLASVSQSDDQNPSQDQANGTTHEVLKRKLAVSSLVDGVNGSKPDKALLISDVTSEQPRSPSGISSDFVMIEREQSGDDGDEVFRSQSPMSASLSHDSHSDDEPRSRNRPKKRKGSRRRINSPHALRRLLTPRSSKEKLEVEPAAASQLKPTGSSIGRMFGKLTRGNSAKANKYRYSREMRDVTRRGSKGPSSLTDSEMSLMSLVESESKVVTSPSDGKSPPKVTRKTSRPTLETSDIVVHPRYDLHVQAKRKISEHQVRCLVQTSVDHDKQPAIVSCAGYYDDDESILRWTCHTRENVWMQLPIEETT